MQSIGEMVRARNLQFMHDSALYSPLNLPPDEGLVVDFPYHPTLLEVSTRATEIEHWEVINAAGGYRHCGSACVGLTVFGVFYTYVALDRRIPPNYPWNIPLYLLAIAFFIAAAVFGMLHFYRPQGPRPTPLEVVPFSAAENKVLLSEQEPEVYFTACACPGCGDVGVHQMRMVIPGDPEWAEVIRHCDVCGREWAQK